MADTMTLAPGQRWAPTKAGTRQKARTVQSMTPEGAITLQEGDDPGALIYWNVDSFRAWIARHEAVVQEGGVMKRRSKAWNGGSREAALAASKKRTEEAIASGCARCPACRGEGKVGGEICTTCGAAGFLVPEGGMPVCRKGE